MGLHISKVFIFEGGSCSTKMMWFELGQSLKKPILWHLVWAYPFSKSGWYDKNPSSGIGTQVLFFELYIFEVWAHLLVFWKSLVHLVVIHLLEGSLIILEEKLQASSNGSIWYFCDRDKKGINPLSIVRRNSLLEVFYTMICSKAGILLKGNLGKDLGSLFLERKKL